MKSQRRQVGARFVARARGAFGFARLSPKNSARNSASLGQATGRRANVAQHGQDLTENGGVNAEPTQASVQFAGMQESLRMGNRIARFTDGRLGSGGTNVAGRRRSAVMTPPIASCAFFVSCAMNGRCVDCGWEPSVVMDFRQFDLGPPPVEQVLAELRERFSQGEKHLHADHQVPIHDRPDLRLSLDNLRTRCNGLPQCQDHARIGQPEREPGQRGPRVARALRAATDGGAVSTGATCADVGPSGAFQGGGAGQIPTSQAPRPRVASNV